MTDLQTSDPDDQAPDLKTQVDQIGLSSERACEFHENSPVAQTPEVVRTVHVDVSRAQERTRGYMALGLFAAMVVVMLALLIGGLAGTPLETVERLGTLLLSPLLGLFGAAAGFYYGGKGH